MINTFLFLLFFRRFSSSFPNLDSKLHGPKSPVLQVLGVEMVGEGGPLVEPPSSALGRRAGEHEFGLGVGVLKVAPDVTAVREAAAAKAAQEAAVGAARDLGAHVVVVVAQAVRGGGGGTWGERASFDQRSLCSDTSHPLTLGIAWPGTGTSFELYSSRSF